MPNGCINAFLQGDLNEEVYMQLLEGVSNQGDHKVCRVLKSLHALKQALRKWNSKFTEAVINGGYNQSKHDYSLQKGGKVKLFTGISG